MDLGLWCGAAPRSARDPEPDPAEPPDVKEVLAEALTVLERVAAGP